MRNLIGFILLLPLFINCQAEKNRISKYPAQIGDIVFDENADEAEFKKCWPQDLSFQYYNDSKGVQYLGEKIKIERELKTLNLRDTNSSNGYITIRFVVNCAGKTGMFRIQEMNQNYEKFAFDKKFTHDILEFSKKLNAWIPKEYLGVKINYYQYLTFKIENGKVSEILP